MLEMNERPWFSEQQKAVALLRILDSWEYVQNQEKMLRDESYMFWGKVFWWTLSKRPGDHMAYKPLMQFAVEANQNLDIALTVCVQKMYRLSAGSLSWLIDHYLLLCGLRQDSEGRLEKPIAAAIAPKTRGWLLRRIGNAWSFSRQRRDINSQLTFLFLITMVGGGFNLRYAHKEGEIGQMVSDLAKLSYPAEGSCHHEALNEDAEEVLGIIQEEKMSPEEIAWWMNRFAVPEKVSKKLAHKLVNGLSAKGLDSLFSLFQKKS